MPSLTGKQRRYLRGLGHHLKPALMIGKDGVTESVITSAGQYLDAHELMKIRLQDGCPLSAREASGHLRDVLGAETAQRIGRILLLYRPAAEGRICLPR